jgi:hypothetical protein
MNLQIEITDETPTHVVLAIGTMLITLSGGDGAGKLRSRASPTRH